MSDRTVSGLKSILARPDGSPKQLTRTELDHIADAIVELDHMRSVIDNVSWQSYGKVVGTEYSAVITATQKDCMEKIKAGHV